ncbi:PAAR domain-containing protein [Pantoea sp.]|uniref:PAAR domain-containing protein n=1 Tax=Pantoea sp. TaxID=69393 RepID=UPI00289AAE30|nr:PAAR domain-containing protein [Pantoea sp.]
MSNAVRVSDTTCHGGAAATGSGDVFINNLPAALTSLTVVPCPIPTHCVGVVATGSGTVFINNLPAVSCGAVTSCGAAFVSGSCDVFIGS